MPLLLTISRAGELLVKTKLHEGGRPKKQLYDVTVSEYPTLEKLGVDKIYSYRSQSIAAAT